MLEDRPPVPHWDAVRRRLYLGDQFLWQYERPAPMQEIILAAFEEDGWPRHLDDPLPGEEGRSAKDRLHHTLRNINETLKHTALRFGADGARHGLHWLTRAGRLPRG